MQVESVVLDRVSGVFHGFGTTKQEIPDSFKESWERRRPQHKQVHGSDLAIVEREGQDCGAVDSFFTGKKRVPIGVMTADCVPVLMANRQGTHIAAIHAGWRGTRAHILDQVWEKLRARGEEPANWVAAIGPAIGPCCYEVSVELAEDFFKEFRYLDGSGKLAVPTHRQLDLQNINAALLKRIGLHEVEVLPFCTQCSVSPRFHSFRREGGKARQWAIIEAI